MNPRRRLLVALVMLGVATFAGCGASSELEVLTDEEFCDASEGAEWLVDGCGGASDRCDVGVCETYNGGGCHCGAPGMCWNGSACVEGTSMANSHEASPT